MSSTPDTAPVTVGTAGHIDHGKTLLVERLTGMRADRPYERERGMTIDIGYAEMAAPDGRRVGFVDLPGHERFIRNMVAGATGVDVVLLVVAADDGVMPQTREHVDILGLLGVRRGIVVLNKTDLVEEDLRDLALEELREFLAGTCLAEAPVLTCSAATGEGVDAVRAALLACVREVAATEDAGSFFLSVQRRFAAQGFGCIVNGVPSAGSVEVGDDVELLPAGRHGRVRAIEIYHAPAQRARAGHRTSLNLAGIHHEDVARGMTVCEPGIFTASRHVVAEVTLLPSCRRPLRHAAGVRLLTGTLEEMARVYLFEGEALPPGGTALVEVRTANRVTARDGNPLILRSDNARDTIGGGRVVRLVDGPVGRRAHALHRELQAWAAALGDPEAMLRTALARSGTAAAPALARECQLRREAAVGTLERLRAAGELTVLAGGAWAAVADVERAAAGLRGALEGMHAENPLLASLPLADVRDRAGLNEAMLAAAVERLGSLVVAEARTLRLATHAVSLDADLAHAADLLLEGLRAHGFAPPPPAEVGSQQGLGAPLVARALTLLTDRGALRTVAPGLVYGKGQLDEGLRLLAAVAARRGSFEPVDAKAVLGGISRKWLIPLLEFYDRIGATRRDGNARLLTRRGETMVREGIDAK